MSDNSISPQQVDELYKKLKVLQEAKGFFFNKDTEFTKDLLAQLLAVKTRFGYMACPCRLANGTRELDKDIICPCEYREADIKEFGVCFCGLYASKAWNEGRIPHEAVPERRPPEKIIF